MHAVGLILVSMVGVSTGTVLVLGRRRYEPSLWDLLATVAVWLLAFRLAETFGRLTALLLAFALGLTIGLVVSFLRSSLLTATEEIPDSELPAHAREQLAPSEALTVWQRAKQGWATYGERMGNVQGRLLMGFFYFIVVLPFGLIARVVSDPLRIKRRPERTGWTTWDDATTTLTDAQEQG